MIKGGDEVSIDPYRFADAEHRKLPEESEHVRKGKAGDGVIYDRGRRLKLYVKETPDKVGVDGRRACKTSRFSIVSPEEW